MVSLPIPDKPRAILRGDLKDQLKSQLPVLQPVTQAEAILAHHQSQGLFHQTARFLDRTVDRVSRFHRAGYESQPTPIRQGNVLRADQLAADGSPDAIVVEIEKIRDQLCEDQATHLVEASLPDLANLGAVGVVEELANGGLRVRFLKNGAQVTVDAVFNGQLRTAHSVSFGRRVKGLMAKPLKDLLSVSSVICLQASDDQGNLVEVPQQFLMAQLGPFVIASSPRLSSRPPLLSSRGFSSPFGGKLNASGSMKVSLPGVTKSATFASTLGLLGAGFVNNSGQGTSMLIAGSLLTVGGCLYSLNNQAS